MTAADKLKAARDFPPVVDHLRKTSEAIVLLLVILSPWAWGCVHPLCRYFLTAGIAFLLLLWAVELLIAPRPFSMSRRFVIPIGGLVSIAILQLLPLGSMVGMISPQSAAIQAELMPNEMEVLADGATAEPPFWTARGRVSVYPAETMRRCLWLIQVVLLFVRVQSLASVDTIRRLCLACMINGSVLAYFAVIHHFTAEEPGRTFWVFQSRGASFGPFINRNHFAFYTNICFGLSIGLLGSRQMGTDAGKGLEGLVSNLKDAKSLWMASVLVFMLGAVILCSSRGGMLSLAGALIITAVFVASTGSFKHGWKWFALAATIFMLAAATQMWLGFDFLESRYTNHEDDRTQLWLPLLRLIPKFPIIGSGLGTLAQLEPSTRTDGMLGDFYLEYAHNEYLQLAIETGIVGLLCGCGFLLMLTLKVAKRIRDSRHNAWLYVGLLFSLSTIALHSFAEFGLAVPAIAVLAATVFGHIAGLGRIQSTDAPAVSTRICQAVFAVCLLAVAALSVRDAKLNDLAQRSNISALRHKRVIHETRLLRDRVQQGKIDEAKEQVPSEAELTAEIDRHIGEAMQDYDTAVAYGTDNTELLLDGVELRFEERTDFTLADPNELLKAQKAVVHARELCPLNESNFFIGYHSSTFQRADDRLSYLLRARAARPVDSTLAYITGITYLDAGEEEKAVNHMRSSIALSTDDHLLDILEHFENGRFPNTTIEQLLPDNSAHALSSAANWLEAQHADDDTDDDDDESAAMVKGLRRKALNTTEIKQSVTLEMHQLKARLHAKLGDDEAAIKAYVRALRYEPSNIRCRMELARLHAKLERYKAAKDELKAVLRFDRNYRPADALLKEIISAEIKSRN